MRDAFGKRREIMIGKTIHRFMLWTIVLSLPFGWSECTQGNPNDLSDSEKALSLLLQFPPSGTLNTAFLATDDQGDANINQFTISSNGISYNVNLSYSYIRLDSIQSDVALRDTIRSGFLAKKWSQIFDSALYAHTTTTPTVAGATVYTIATGAILSNFHVANGLLVTGSAYKSGTYTFTSVRQGSVALLKWHVNELVLGGTVTDVTNSGPAKNFEIRLPAFDVDLVPACSSNVSMGSIATMYMVFKMHNILKDTTDPTNGHILNQIYTSGIASVNSQSNPALTNVVLTNTSKSFLFYGCSL